MSRRFDDQGQVLGLALAFLTFVAIILAVTLSASGANLDATNQLATQRNQQYAADGAIQAAVNNIRGNPALGADNGQNCDYTTPAAFANSLQVQVSCTPFPGSGTGTASQNRPPYSFLALPTAGSTLEGFFQIPTNGNGGGTSDVNVFGPVASNGIVNETGNGSGQLLIAGNVTAHSCNGDVNVTNTTVYTKVCNSSATIADPGVANPTAYALMSPSAPAMAQAPACLSGAAEFFPGTYNAFPAAPGGCSTKPMWFQPGAYYFDFTGAGSHAWDLSGKTIVGGTPKNWDPTSASTPAPPIGSTGSCRSEHDFPPNAGVQWVFGGDSRISVGSGLLELCAQPSTTQQQLAIVGLQTDAASPQTPVENPTTAASATNPAYAPLTSPTIDNTDAQVLALAKNKTVSLDLTGFAAPASGLLVKHVQMSFKHRETSNGASGTLLLKDSTTVIATFTTACTTGQLCLSPDATTYRTDTIDVTSLFLLDPTVLSRLTATWSYTTPNTNNTTWDTKVDGISFAVTASPTPGGYRAMSGCMLVTQDASGNAIPCPLLLTPAPSGSNTKLMLQGTVYAPTVGVDITTGVGDPILFNRGLIARNITFRLHPGNGSPSVNGAGAGANRFVVFTASIGGRVVTKSLVEFDDTTDITQPGSSIDFLSWDVRRGS